MIGKFRGMGQDCMSYAELSSGVENCTQTDLASASACVESNMNVQQAISNLQIAYHDCVPTNIPPPAPSSTTPAPVQWVTDSTTGQSTLQIVPVDYVGPSINYYQANPVVTTASTPAQVQQVLNTSGVSVPTTPIVTTNSTAGQSVNTVLSANTGAQNTTNSTAGQNDGTTAGLSVGSWLEETFSVAGIDVPYWAVGAAGLGVVLLMMGMSGRR